MIRRLPVASLLALVSTLVLSAASQASFPGLNGKITFHTTRTGIVEEVFSVNPDGSDYENLSSNDAKDATPSWSPDGRKIAFASQRTIDYPNPEGDYEIFVMNADGTEQTQLTFNDVDDRSPNWSRDSSRLAFERRSILAPPPAPGQEPVLGPSDIYIMPSSGGTATNCTSNAAEDHNPSWSPIEDKIAFSSNRTTPGPIEDIWVTGVSGTSCTGAPDNLTDWTYPAFNRGPDWSPDGMKIAFYSDRDPDPNVVGGRNEEVWVMNANGSDLTNLTKDPAADRVPAWSPDGTTIAFDTDRGTFDATTRIWLMNADGENPRPLSNKRDVGPDWQPTFAPSASFSVSPASALTGQLVTLDAGGSSDRFGRSLSYQWDLEGDGIFVPGGSVITVAPARAGQVTASLIVTNPDGNSARTSRSFSIGSRPPRPFLRFSPNPAFNGETVTFDGSGSYDPDGEIAKYEWDLDGNGSFETNSGANPKVTRSFRTARRFDIRLRVTDNDGVTAETDADVTASGVRGLTVRARALASDAFLSYLDARNGIRVRTLLVRDVPTGARVEIQCRGSRRNPCRRLVRTTFRPGARAARTIRFNALNGRVLKAGTRVEIRVMKRDYVGRFISYRIRKGGFRRQQRCLEPGSRAPKRRCGGGEER